MPVVINEFEVVPEPPPAAPSAEDKAPPGAMPVPDTQKLAELDRLLTRDRERLLRVRPY